MQNEESPARWSKKRADGEESREAAGLAHVSHLDQHKTSQFCPEQDSRPQAEFDPE